MGRHGKWDGDEARRIVDTHAAQEGAMLPILHALQAAFGYIDDAAIPVIASALNVSRAEVFGCLSFYHDFRRTPAGRHELKLCRAEACQAMGADALHTSVLRDLETDWHGTTSDGAVTVEPVFCLGLCACGPAAMLDGAPLARLTPSKVTSVLADADRAAAA
jgi:formate dehydrogenase subunit gamma